MFKLSKITGALIAAGTVLGGPLGGAIGYGIGKAINNSSKSSSSSSSYSHDKNLNYGDIIYVNRGLYKHFGVYCDDNSIIHYSSLKSDIGSDNEIIDTDLKTFKREDSKIYKLIFPDKYDDPSSILTTGVIANRKETRILINSLKYHLYSPTETVERARSRLGEKKYNLALNNCEHFAIWCKTGISESHQINALLESKTNESVVY